MNTSSLDMWCCCQFITRSAAKEQQSQIADRHRQIQRDTILAEIVQCEKLVETWSQEWQRSRHNEAAACTGVTAIVLVDRGTTGGSRPQLSALPKATLLHWQDGKPDGALTCQRTGRTYECHVS